MRVQDEKIKGFNVLELIVVVALIGVISAIGYPNFSEWRKDRETRSAVLSIKSLIEGINSQVQRGQYAFVQVHILEEVNGAERNLIVTSKGMKSEKLASLLNDGTAMVIFLVLIKMVEGEEMDFSTILWMFVRLSFGGIALGLIGGMVLS